MPKFEENQAGSSELTAKDVGLYGVYSCFISIVRSFVWPNKCALLFIFLLTGCETNNTLYVYNNTKQPIYIQEILVDNRVVFKGNYKLQVESDRFDWNNIFGIKFKLSPPENLLLTYQDINKNTQQASCKLKDENGAGCLFLMSIHAENKEATCFCDSYSIESKW